MQTTLESSAVNSWSELALYIFRWQYQSLSVGFLNFTNEHALPRAMASIEEEGRDPAILAFRTESSITVSCSNREQPGPLFMKFMPFAHTASLPPSMAALFSLRKKIIKSSHNNNQIVKYVCENYGKKNTTTLVSIRLILHTSFTDVIGVWYPKQTDMVIP